MAEEQNLIVELRLKLATPKMSAVSLANGIRKIILAKWPECQVELKGLAINWIADADIKPSDDEEEDGCDCDCDHS